ncbi:fluoride efflux transporter CrcB [Pontibacillus litoralis]|uniref:Fluoride-specific ion channel FluC n=1 Tax=Pontibacillus litoralis JSM 072002 TaxID=1385512 RepID=A0A0A5G3P7_9BACI|nr:fluoride efflux transporter CrcB [Pontibacillus litoralis]KGX85763.1 camphor resistance protein CrcB [Pontibacillus litoralis JSM 072002]
MNEYISVFIGGCIGAVGRFIITLAVPDSYLFPYETLLANWFGCFLLTFLMAHPFLSSRVPKHLMTGIGTGIIGSFTTFSTFSVETANLWMEGYGIEALLYISLSIIGGLVLAWSGTQAAKMRG